MEEFEVGVTYNGATHVGVSSLFRREETHIPWNGTAVDGGEEPPEIPPPPLYVIGREKLSQCSSLDMETHTQTPRQDLLFSVEQVCAVYYMLCVATASPSRLHAYTCTHTHPHTHPHTSHIPRHPLSPSCGLVVACEW
jgi:hypothetical protein